MITIIILRPAGLSCPSGRLIGRRAGSENWQKSDRKLERAITKLVHFDRVYVGRLLFIPSQLATRSMNIQQHCRSIRFIPSSSPSYSSSSSRVYFIYLFIYLFSCCVASSCAVLISPILCS